MIHLWLGGWSNGRMGHSAVARCYEAPKVKVSCNVIVLKRASSLKKTHCNAAFSEETTLREGVGIFSYNPD